MNWRSIKLILFLSFAVYGTLANRERVWASEPRTKLSAKFPVPKTSPSCHLKRDDTRTLSFIIDTVSKRDTQLGACTDETHSKQNPHAGIAGIEKINHVLSAQAPAAEPSAKDMREFTQKLWQQSMANLVVSKVDFEMRYTSDAKNRHPKANLEKIIQDLNSRNSASGKSGAGSKASDLGSSALVLARAQGQKYISNFVSSKEVAMLPEEAAADLKARELYLHQIRGKLKPDEYDAIEAKVYGFGTGLLHYMNALKESSNLSIPENVEVFPKLQTSKTKYETYALKTDQEYQKAADQLVFKPALVKDSLKEYQSAIEGAASDLNAKTDLALHNPGGAPNLSAILSLITSNPVAVGQVLKANPNFRNQICFYLQHIEQTNQVVDWQTIVIKSLTWATGVIDGVSFLPKILESAGMTFGREALENLAAIRTVNGAIANSTFALSSGLDGIRKLKSDRDIEVSKQSIVANGQKENQAASQKLAERLNTKREEGAAIDRQLAVDAVLMIPAVYQEAKHTFSENEGWNTPAEIKNAPVITNQNRAPLFEKRINLNNLSNEEKAALPAVLDKSHRVGSEPGAIGTDGLPPHKGVVDANGKVIEKGTYTPAQIKEKYRILTEEGHLTPEQAKIAIREGYTGNPNPFEEIKNALSSQVKKEIWKGSAQKETEVFSLFDRSGKKINAIKATKLGDAYSLSFEGDLKPGEYAIKPSKDGSGFKIKIRQSKASATGKLKEDAWYEYDIKTNQKTDRFNFGQASIRDHQISWDKSVDKQLDKLPSAIVQKFKDWAKQVKTVGLR